MAKSQSNELTGEARKAFAAVADALAEWRDEFATSTERFTESVSDKIAEAGQAVGWPKEVVEASRAHFTQMSNLQLRMFDQLIDAWQKQLKSPASASFMSTLQASSAGLGGAPALVELASKPVEIWMQAAMAWQRNMSSAWSLWAGMEDRDQNERRSRSH